MRKNFKNRGDGLKLLRKIRADSAALVFFDPQYRAILDRMSYGNEGARQIKRFKMRQMTDETIRDMAKEMERILRPSGHVAMWMDKYTLCNYGANPLFSINVVDLITWDKMKIGMGYRTRRRGEYLMILQKAPLRSKGVWRDKRIPDVWQERQVRDFPHRKPDGLQRRLILSMTEEGDLVVDPCAGSFGVLDACKEIKRDFLGCDVTIQRGR